MSLCVSSLVHSVHKLCAKVGWRFDLIEQLATFAGRRVRTHLHRKRGRTAVIEAHTGVTKWPHLISRRLWVRVQEINVRCISSVKCFLHRGFCCLAGWQRCMDGVDELETFTTSTQTHSMQIRYSWKQSSIYVVDGQWEREVDADGARQLEWLVCTVASITNRIHVGEQLQRCFYGTGCRQCNVESTLWRWKWTSDEIGYNGVLDLWRLIQVYFLYIPRTLNRNPKIQMIVNSSKPVFLSDGLALRLPVFR